ncbi:DUF4342 domain-containing protein [Sinanaerobacter sp. ZZT-01]|uniref:DUF4342 domain-containing protein n=1 Tax=Sinanaerobacter sp. ZZT-01 TaxID=3111540 RepID=UPI002D771E5F|nr:DUF4342 domain-containing protein [Sinanaerobacter sp. ZZT-01]WRR92887.1 DUF4342 domain-containing protein [Sinanaerobacter sp. ZZT-01]
MEITLEKIELVKDRTGVSYKEAKEALEAAEGSVVDAIINIEESIDLSSKSKLGEQGAEIIDLIKDMVRKGNIAKIIIKKEDDVLLNLPLNVGIIGTIIFPWTAVFATIAAFGTKCRIELVKDNGEVVNVSGMATDTFENMKEKSSVIADEMKVKGTDVFNNVKEKANEALRKNTETEDFEKTGEEDDSNCTCGCGEPVETCGCESSCNDEEE